MPFNTKKTTLKALSPVKSFAMAMSVGLTLIGTGLAVTYIAPPQAYAQTGGAKAVVDSGKASGQVGETISGYLEAVSGASASSDLRNAINEINIGRKSVYTRLAREQNLSVDVIATLTGEKQLAKAASGQKIKDASGQWKTK